jgi:hypothetical protein
MAASAPSQAPPSENESGVTLTTPITRQRSRLGSPGSEYRCSAAERLTMRQAYGVAVAGCPGTPAMHCVFSKVRVLRQATAVAAATTCTGRSHRPKGLRSLAGF